MSDQKQEKKKQPRVHISELSRIKMVAGNEKKYPKIIHDGTIKEWVGFGWVTWKVVPEKLDYLMKTLPIVVSD